MAITSKEVNLTQLGIELGGKGLIADFTDPKKKLILPADGVDLTEDELKDAIAKHVAIDDDAERQARREAIADRIGLTADELKLLLG
jgi:hypothetical protein